MIPPERLIKANRIYTYSNYGNEFDFDIAYEKEIQTPIYLYKYYSNQDYNLEAFVEGYFYASESRQLNDLFDCSPEIIGERDFSYLNEILCNISLGKPPKLKYNEFNKREIIKFYLVGSMFRNWGILSLTQEYNNQLMWSHYTQNQGFVLKINTAKLKSIESEIIKFYKPFFINYLDKIEDTTKIYYNDFKESPRAVFLYLSNIKSKLWDYEKEWRVICQNRNPMKLPKLGENSGVDRKFFYSKDCIESIYLGVHFFDIAQEVTIGHNSTVEIRSKNCSKIKLLEQVKKRNIECYLMVKEPMDFTLKPLRLEFEIVDYERVRGTLFEN